MSAARRFRSLFGVRNLRKIYYDRVHHGNSIGLDRTRPRALQARIASEVEIINRKSSAGTYRFTPYKEKLISKGAGAPPRQLSIPTARDRITLRALCQLLGAVFPEVELELPQVTIDSLSHAVGTGAFAEYVKIDLKNFYPSIPHAVLLKAIRRRIRKKEIIHLIEEAIETPTVPERRGGHGAPRNDKGVPQGLAISNTLAEIAIMDVDKDFEARGDLWYRRFVDDILILTPTGQGHLVADEVVRSLNSLGLTPHPPGLPGSKSRVGPLTEAFTFLGYEIAQGRIQVKRDSVERFESSIAGILTGYRHKLVRLRSAAQKQQAIDYCRWRLNLRITGCIFQGRRMGWVFYFSQVNDTSRLRGVDKTIATLLRRFSLEHEIVPKRLLKTYYESKRKDKDFHHYIPNFDTMTILQKREILRLMIGYARVATLSDRKIEEIFSMRISVAIRELEADLSGMS